MCHFDLHSQNMILDSSGNVWLIDWAYAGAYPPYFEKAALSRNVDPAFAQGLLRLMNDGRYTEEIRQLEAIGFALTIGAFCKPSEKLVRSRLELFRRILIPPSSHRSAQPPDLLRQRSGQYHRIAFSHSLMN